jgi:hypothetical protein
MSLHDDVFVTYTVFTFGIGNIVSTILQEGMSLHDDVVVTYTVFTFGIGNIV